MNATKVPLKMKPAATPMVPPQPSSTATSAKKNVVAASKTKKVTAKPLTVKSFAKASAASSKMALKTSKASAVQNKAKSKSKSKFVDEAKHKSVPIFAVDSASSVCESVRTMDLDFDGASPEDHTFHDSQYYIGRILDTLDKYDVSRLVIPQPLTWAPRPSQTYGDSAPPKKKLAVKSKVGTKSIAKATGSAVSKTAIPSDMEVPRKKVSTKKISSGANPREEASIESAMMTKDVKKKVTNPSRNMPLKKSKSKKKKQESLLGTASNKKTSVGSQVEYPSKKIPLVPKTRGSLLE
eukprot:Lankesteria_metandrocarpae@DN8342_c0_g1_i1.p1